MINYGQYLHQIYADRMTSYGSKWSWFKVVQKDPQRICVVGYSYTENRSQPLIILMDPIYERFGQRAEEKHQQQCEEYLAHESDTGHNGGYTEYEDQNK